MLAGDGRQLVDTLQTPAWIFHLQLFVEASVAFRSDPSTTGECVRSVGDQTPAGLQRMVGNAEQAPRALDRCDVDQIGAVDEIVGVTGNVIRGREDVDCQRREDVLRECVHVVLVDVRADAFQVGRVHVGWLEGSEREVLGEMRDVLPSTRADLQNGDGRRIGNDMVE